MGKEYTHMRMRFFNIKDNGVMELNMVMKAVIVIVCVGYGILIMKDGGSYEGDFRDGEICGKGERTWPDGTIYKGEFEMGEK